MPSNLVYSIVRSEISCNDTLSSSTPLISVEQFLGKMKILDCDGRQATDEMAHQLVSLPEMQAWFGALECLTNEWNSGKALREVLWSS